MSVRTRNFLGFKPQLDKRLQAIACSLEAGHARWWEQEIAVNGKIQKGELMTYNLTELIKPEAYEVRLTPVTIFGDGDSTIRVIKYSEAISLFGLNGDPP
ncbi:UNVERIFIED_CONTAM: MAM domain-containing glycosylphosphatidylinositol anchor protein 2 [Gekko kuhli]